eukprot:5837852-Amphidinium_carterae.1
MLIIASIQFALHPGTSRYPPASLHVEAPVHLSRLCAAGAAGSLQNVAVPPAATTPSRKLHKQLPM